MATPKAQKVFVLMVSKQFMRTHPRKGQPTEFRTKILQCVNGKVEVSISSGFDPVRLERSAFEMSESHGKRHTCRQNYNYWQYAAQEINSGRAVLSLREWSGKPYRSPQAEFLQLHHIHVQKLVAKKITVNKKPTMLLWIDGKTFDDITTIAANDGFSDRQDFIDWFPENIKDGVIIHFKQDFKYGN